MVDEFILPQPKDEYRVRTLSPVRYEESTSNYMLLLKLKLYVSLSLSLSLSLYGNKGFRECSIYVKREQPPYPVIQCCLKRAGREVEVVHRATDKIVDIEMDLDENESKDNIEIQ